jgi:hypothetical protein
MLKYLTHKLKTQSINEENSNEKVRKSVSAGIFRKMTITFRLTKVQDIKDMSGVQKAKAVKVNYGLKLVKISQPVTFLFYFRENLCVNFWRKERYKTRESE